MEFVEYMLSGDASSPQFTRRVDHAAQFFLELDRSFVTRDELTPDSIVKKLSSKLFRQHLLASRFVTSKLGSPEFEEKRDQGVEQQRIANILNRSGSQAYVASLSSYAQWLNDQKVATRTSRLYLRAAEGFCLHCGVDGTTQWTEATILEYLKASPGQAASLGRFVTYCRKQLEWDVRIPPKALWKRQQDIATEVRTLRKSIRALETTPDDRLTTKELAAVLSLALDVPAAQLIRERASAGITRHSDGAIEVWRDAVIEETHPLYRFALRWADLSDAYTARQARQRQHTRQQPANTRLRT